MSHSTVLVVVRDAINAEEAEALLDDLLEPFNENTEVAPYFTATDESGVKQAVKYYRDHPEACDGDCAPTKPYDEFVVDAETEIEWTRQAVGAWERSDPDDGVYKDGGFGSMSTYNPDSRWDWWTLGGRWHGFFQLKPKVPVGAEPLPEYRKKFGPVGAEDGRIEGSTTVKEFNGEQEAILGVGGVFGDPEGENFEGRADLARKGDIDFDAMRILQAAKAADAYDKFEAATAGLEVADSWNEVLRKTFFDNDMDPDGEPVDDDAWRERRQAVVARAREIYGTQPWVKALREADLDSFFGEPIEDWCVHTGGRDAYIQKAIDRVGSTFAILVDGEWVEKGRMGWFGMTSGEKDEGIWNRELRKLVDGLDDSTYLAVVDVHI